MNDLKVVDFKVQPESKESIMFKNSLCNLSEILDNIDRAGAAIREENLSLQVLMEISSLLTIMWRPEVRESMANMKCHPKENKRNRGVSHV